MASGWLANRNRSQVRFPFGSGAQASDCQLGLQSVSPGRVPYSNRLQDCIDGDVWLDVGGSCESMTHWQGPTLAREGWALFPTMHLKSHSPYEADFSLRCDEEKKDAHKRVSSCDEYME